jgi:hypothetical protein
MVVPLLQDMGRWVDMAVANDRVIHELEASNIGKQGFQVAVMDGNPDNILNFMVRTLYGVAKALQALPPRPAPPRPAGRV